ARRLAMRYLAGFIGGFVVAILLFAFQHTLIGAEQLPVIEETPAIVLASVSRPTPIEYKPYEPRKAPPKPEPVTTPAVPAEPVDPATPRPVLKDLPTLR